jgi:hypothetical protein
MRSVLPPVVVTGILAFLAGIPGEASAQGVTVTGTVVERTQGSWIGGATVRLSGSRPFFTDLDGQFRFTGVAPGRHTLSVQAMGYRARILQLELRADTVLTVELDPDPIVLDSLLVEAGTIDIEGEIYDRMTGDRVLYAQVRVVPGNRTEGAISGGFTLRKVPKGQAVTVVVESVGYEPAGISLITRADTTLRVELEHDSVGIRMLAQQVERLERRSWSLPLSRDVITGEDMLRAPGSTALDMLRVRLLGTGHPLASDRFRPSTWCQREGGAGLKPICECLFIDDVKVRDFAYFWGLTAGEVERVEIYGRGKMIRVYTKRYIMAMMGKRTLPSMVFLNIGLGNPVCR